MEESNTKVGDQSGKGDKSASKARIQSLLDKLRNNIGKKDKSLSGAKAALGSAFSKGAEQAVDEEIQKFEREFNGKLKHIEDAGELLKRQLGPDAESLQGQVLNVIKDATSDGKLTQKEEAQIEDAYLKAEEKIEQRAEQAAEKLAEAAEDGKITDQELKDIESGA